LDSIGELLDSFRVFSHEALFCTVCGVWYITGIGAKRSNNVAAAFEFKAGGEGLEFYGVRMNPAL